MTAITPSIQGSWDGPGFLGAGQNGQALLWDNATGKFVAGPAGVTAHSGLTGLTTGDDHTQYALLAGRSGGQSITGGTGSGQNLTLASTSHATKGLITASARLVVLNDVTDQGLSIQARGTTTTHRLDIGVEGGVPTIRAMNYGVAAMSVTVRNVIATTATTTTVPLIAKGAASQTANLQEWQDSAGTVLAAITSAGVLGTLTTINGSGSLTLQASAQQFLSGSSANVILYKPTILSATYMAAASSGAVTLPVRGSSGGVANIQEWQDSAGTVLAKVEAGGRFIVPTGSRLGVSLGTSAAMGLWISGDQLGLASSAVDCLTIRSSGNTVHVATTFQAAVTLPAGSVSSPALMVSDGGGLYRGATGYLNFSTAGTRRMQLYSALNLFVPIIPETAATVPLIVQGAASQTADLQQWQNSSGTVQAALGPTGQIKTNQTAANTNTPSGATARHLPLYDTAGTLLGYIPIYAAAW